MLNEKPYAYGTINMPHDAKAKTFSTSKSALEQFIEAFKGTEVAVNLVPKLSVEDGIEASRQLLKYAYFDYDRCYYGIECLRVYRKKWDELNQVFSNTPLHDYSSDSADAFRYAAIVANKRVKPIPKPHEALNEALRRNGEYRLDELYADRARMQAKSSIQRQRI